MCSISKHFQLAWGKFFASKYFTVCRVEIISNKNIFSIHVHTHTTYIDAHKHFRLIKHLNYLSANFFFFFKDLRSYKHWLKLIMEYNCWTSKHFIFYNMNEFVVAVVLFPDFEMRAFQLFFFQLNRKKNSHAVLTWYWLTWAIATAYKTLIRFYDLIRKNQ